MCFPISNLCNRASCKWLPCVELTLPPYLHLQHFLPSCWPRIPFKSSCSLGGSREEFHSLAVVENVSWGDSCLYKMIGVDIEFYQMENGAQNVSQDDIQGDGYNVRTRWTGKKRTKNRISQRPRVSEVILKAVSSTKFVQPMDEPANQRVGRYRSCSMLYGSFRNKRSRIADASSALPPRMLVSWGCHSKMPKTGWVNTIGIYSFPVLEPRSLKWRYC